jgi:hypothetical protein
MTLDSHVGFPAPEPLENQGPQEPKIDLTDNRPELAFEQVNDVTWKLTDGVGTNQWDGYRGGYRTTRARGRGPSRAQGEAASAQAVL